MINKKINSGSEIIKYIGLSPDGFSKKNTIQAFNAGRKLTPYRSANTAMHALNQQGIPAELLSILYQGNLVDRLDVTPPEYKKEIRAYYEELIGDFLQAEECRQIATRILLNEKEKDNHNHELIRLISSMSQLNEFNNLKPEEKLRSIFAIWTHLIRLQENSQSQRIIIWFERTLPAIKNLGSAKEIISDIENFHLLATKLSSWEAELFCRDSKPLVAIAKQLLADFENINAAKLDKQGKNELLKLQKAIACRLEKAGAFFERAYKYGISVYLVKGFEEILKIPPLLQESSLAYLLQTQLKKIENFINVWLGIANEQSTALIQVTERVHKNPHTNYLRYRAMDHSFENILKKAFFAFSYDKLTIVHAVEKMSLSMEEMRRTTDESILGLLTIHSKVQDILLKITEDINNSHTDYLDANVFDMFLDIIELSIDNQIYAIMPLIYESIPSFFNLYMNLFKNQSEETQHLLERYYSALPFNYEYEQQYKAIAALSNDIFSQIKDEKFVLNFEVSFNIEQQLLNYFGRNKKITISRTNNKNEFRMFTPDTGEDIVILKKDKDPEMFYFLENVFKNNSLQQLLISNDYYNQKISFRKNQENDKSVLNKESIFGQNPLFSIAHLHNTERLELPAYSRKTADFYKQLYLFSRNEKINEKEYVIVKDQSAWHGILIYPKKRLTDNLKNTNFHILNKEPTGNYEQGGLLFSFRKMLKEIKNYMRFSNVPTTNQQNLSLKQSFIANNQQRVLIESRWVVFDSQETVSCPKLVPTVAGVFNKLNFESSVPLHMEIKEEIKLPDNSATMYRVYFTDLNQKELVVDVRLVYEADEINIPAPNVSSDNPLSITVR